MQVVAVKDNAIEQWMNPFTVPHLGLALRHFKDEVSNPESPISKHPEDYDLYHLGSFDGGTGLFSTHPPHQIARAITFALEAKRQMGNREEQETHEYREMIERQRGNGL